MSLGQPLSTLSGGEIQRVKLAQHLDEEIKNSIFILTNQPQAYMNRISLY